MPEGRVPDAVPVPASPDGLAGRFGGVLHRYTALLLTGVLLATLLGFASAVHRLLEHFCHFRLQYMALGVLALVVFLGSRRWRWVIASILCLVLNGFEVVPWYLPVSGGEPAVPAQGVRVLVANVYTANRQHARLCRVVQRAAPDVVALLEVNRRWWEALSPLRATHPHVHAVPRSDNFGVALLCRWPFVAETVFWGRARVPSIRARVQTPSGLVTVVVTHPVPPGSDEGHALRNDQLRAVADAVRRSSGPLVLLGDLNTTMWSVAYRRFADSSGLVNARRGSGALPTWPTHLPLLLIPLDHVLYTPSTLRPLSCQLGEDVGSDHLPLLAELELRR